MGGRWLGWIAAISLFLGAQFAINRNLASGEPPALSGRTLSGRNFDLSQLRGKPAVIYFWAEWCPICKAMQDSVRAISKDHPFISVAMLSGTPEQIVEYLRKQDFDVPTLPDGDGEIARRYGLNGVPAVFVLGPEGGIRHATMGYTTEIGMRVRLWLAGL